ncbi:MAG: DUF3575 domain-containing protein, partial [Bacteroidales bacterium]|nr:DUF3575 domain-containing protein [Bacteroidales bacterium]
SRGEDWAKLRESVVSDSNLDKESKFRVLAIIDSDDSAENKEERLRKLECWDYIQEHFLPLSRYATVRCSQQPALEAPELPAEEIADSTESIAVPVDTLAMADTTMRVDTLAYAPEVAPAPAASREPRQLGTIVAAKTNLLYDALTALNFELEFPIGRRFSLDIEDVFPWWETGNKYCFQMWEMGLEARFWFKPWDVRGREKLRGWFVGLYGMSSRFDFQNDKKFNYQGEYWSVGGTLGYSMPLGRNKKANLEFSLSTGYLEAPYRHYYPTDDYVKLIKDPAGNGTFYDIFLYPTKAKISLVVPIPGPKKKEVSHE